MDTAVYETLVSVSDSDGNIRSAAENQLKELAAQAGLSSFFPFISVFKKY
jgi:hypothetical protein